jgi:short-subunit dehydrogenase involved in D-alanine esterification of teichoic acids
MNLNGATALVTEGSSGIFFAIAKVLVEGGTRVAITGRNEQKLAAAATALRPRILIE